MPDSLRRRWFSKETTVAKKRKKNKFPLKEERKRVHVEARYSCAPLSLFSFYY